MKDSIKLDLWEFVLVSFLYGWSVDNAKANFLNHCAFGIEIYIDESI